MLTTTILAQRTAMNLLETIQARLSVRAYRTKELEADKRQAMTVLIK
jgi:hypothetical protein